MSSRALASLFLALTACRLAGSTGATNGDGGGAPANHDSGANLADATLVDGAAAPTPDAQTPPDGATPPDAPTDLAHDCTTTGNVASWGRGRVRVSYDLAAGTATFLDDGVPRLARFFAAVKLPALVTTRQYHQRTCTVRGDQTTVVSTGAGLPTLRQTFTVSDDSVITRLSVEGTALASNWIAPLVLDGDGQVSVGAGGGPLRVLRVPFDNDHWISYTSGPPAAATSFEVTALYSNATRAGLVVGSVTHDLWKTGIAVDGVSAGNGDTVTALTTWGGATDATVTHDLVAHGAVRGDVITSPAIFVAAGPDWRDLLDAYARANAARQPPLRAPGRVPFGWNSWGKLQNKLSYANATAVSDFVRSDLQSAGFVGDDAVYINLDSYWDNLSEAQLRAFVDHCRGNGQKAGVYWAPFVDWGKTATRAVEGTGTATAPATYDQIWLRDTAGKPIELDGAYAVDPTHPAAQRRIDSFIDRFKAYGFAYIKLDFLSHGALESSVRADPRITTGIAAYNQGMRYLLDRIGGDMFISASIAPLFPHQYAHARRVSCDTYGAAIGEMSAAYQLNAVTYGFWTSGTLYAFNDPDHLVFEGFGPGDNMTRVISGAISGTVFLSGDDLSGAAGQALARTYLTNPRLNEIARLGQTFRPVDGGDGNNPADLFVLHQGGVHRLAVFNFSDAAVTRTVELPRVGLEPGRRYTVTDVWTGATSNATGTLSVPLDARFARLLSLE